MKLNAIINKLFFLVFDVTGSNLHEVLIVLVLLHGLAIGKELLLADLAVDIGDFLWATNLDELMLLDQLNKVRAIVEGFHSTGIQPGMATT